MYKFFEKLTSFKYILIFFMLMAFFMAVLNMLSASFMNASAGIPVPDIALLGIYPAQFRHLMPEQIISLYSSEALKIYSKIQIIDIFYPAAYVLFLTPLIIRINGKTGTNYILKSMYMLPITAAFLDYLENISIFLMITALPDESFIAPAAKYFCVLKWFFIIASASALIAGLVRKIFISYLTPLIKHKLIKKS